MMLKKIVIRPGARTATRPVSCREELWDPVARKVMNVNEDGEVLSPFLLSSTQLESLHELPLEEREDFCVRVLMNRGVGLPPEDHFYCDWCAHDCPHSCGRAKNAMRHFIDPRCPCHLDIDKTQINVILPLVHEGPKR